VRDRPLLLISVAADGSIYLQRIKMYEPEGGHTVRMGIIVTNVLRCFQEKYWS